VGSSRLNILALLASVFPWSLGKPYDSLAPAPMGIHPEWYFMSPFEMLKLLARFYPAKPVRLREFCSSRWVSCSGS